MHIAAVHILLCGNSQINNLYMGTQFIWYYTYIYTCICTMLESVSQKFVEEGILCTTSIQGHNCVLYHKYIH